MVETHTSSKNAAIIIPTPIESERLKLRLLRASNVDAVFDIPSCQLTTAGRSFAENMMEEAERWLVNRMDVEKRQGFDWCVVETNKCYTQV